MVTNQRRTQVPSPLSTKLKILSAENSHEKAFKPTKDNSTVSINGQIQEQTQEASKDVSQQQSQRGLTSVNIQEQNQLSSLGFLTPSIGVGPIPTPIIKNKRLAEALNNNVNLKT